MSTFIYESADKEGAIVRGELEAADKEKVVEYLERKNLIPLSIEKKGEARGLTKLSFVLFETVSAVDRILLTRHLAATVRAGLSIIEALDILIADAAKNVMKKILSEAKFNLEKGQPLSAIFAAYPNYFPAVFTGMVKAGESSGRLDETLDELGTHLTREYNLTRKVRSALAYPALLLVASVAVIILLLTFVLPRLAKTFGQSGVELPLVTRILVKASAALTYSPLLDVAILAGLIYFFAFSRRTAAGRRVFLIIVSRIPIARDLVKKVALVRFTRTLSSLVSSGVSILDALSLSSDAVANSAYRVALSESLKGVRNGLPLSKTLEERPDLFPRLLVSMIAVGERTGTLEHVLKTFSDFYDEEVDNTLKDLVTFIEPILLLFMGLVVGSIAISILLPIYQLVGKFA